LFRAAIKNINVRQLQFLIGTLRVVETLGLLHHLGAPPLSHTSELWLIVGRILIFTFIRMLFILVEMKPSILSGCHKAELARLNSYEFRPGRPFLGYDAHDALDFVVGFGFQNKEMAL